MKFLNISIFLSAFLISYGFSEIINGPANVRDKDKKLLFELLDSTNVDLNIKDSNWFYIEIIAFVNIKDGKIAHDSGGVVFKKGATIFDEKGKIIGTVKEIFDGYFQGVSNGKIKVFLFGYTHFKNIYETSVLENKLSDVLNNQDGSFESFREHILSNGYENWMPKGDFTIFHRYDAEYLGSPGVRIALIFYKNKLFGIINNRTINFTKDFKYDLLAEQKRYPIYFFEKDKEVKSLFLKYYENVHGGTD